LLLPGLPSLLKNFGVLTVASFLGLVAVGCAAEPASA